jgi:hypothetical protein
LISEGEDLSKVIDAAKKSEIGINLLSMANIQKPTRSIKDIFYLSDEKKTYNDLQEQVVGKLDDLIKAGSCVITDDAEGPDISMKEVIDDLNKLLKPEVNDTDKPYTPVRADSFSTTSTAPSTDDGEIYDRPSNLTKENDGNEPEIKHSGLGK